MSLNNRISALCPLSNHRAFMFVFPRWVVDIHHLHHLQLRWLFSLFLILYLKVSVSRSVSLPSPSRAMLSPSYYTLESQLYSLLGSPPGLTSIFQGLESAPSPSRVILCPLVLYCGRVVIFSSSHGIASRTDIDFPAILFFQLFRG
jgi:hypothetical protein